MNRRMTLMGSFRTTEDNKDPDSDHPQCQQGLHGVSVLKKAD